MNKRTVLGVIPVRIGSERLPSKPLLELGGKPLFHWAVRSASMAKSLDEVIIATDSEKIAEKATSFDNVKCVLTPILPSGSDRAAWIAKNHGAQIVANIQGDEPFLSPTDIDKAVNSLIEDPLASVSTLCFPFSEGEDPSCHSSVKVVVDNRGYALYFSRAKIPFSRDNTPVNYLRHLGLYVYRKDFLIKFAESPQGVLEKTEKLEQLRILEMGEKIKIVYAGKMSFGIDTEDDFIKAQNLVKGEKEKWLTNMS